MKTLEELNALPDEELRVMLSNILNWELFKGVQPFMWGSEYKFMSHDYPQDLNACAAVEKTLEYAEEWHGEEHHANACEAYMGWVQQVSGKDDWDFLTAVARFRTIALILTLQPQ